MNHGSVMNAPPSMKNFVSIPRRCAAMNNTNHPADFQRGRCEARDELGRAVEPISKTMQRWDDERYLERNDLVLARLLRAEAMAGHRAENHVCDASKLPMIRDLLREAITAYTGR